LFRERIATPTVLPVVSTTVEEKVVHTKNQKVNFGVNVVMTIHHPIDHLVVLAIEKVETTADHSANAKASKVANVALTALLTTVPHVDSITTLPNVQHVDLIMIHQNVLLVDLKEIHPIAQHEVSKTAKVANANHITNPKENAVANVALTVLPTTVPLADSITTHLIVQQEDSTMTRQNVQHVDSTMTHQTVQLVDSKEIHPIAQHAVSITAKVANANHITNPKENEVANVASVHPTTVPLADSTTTLPNVPQEDLTMTRLKDQHADLITIHQTVPLVDSKEIHPIVPHVVSITAKVANDVHITQKTGIMDTTETANQAVNTKVI
jgi:hypothetical protein